MTCWQGHVPRMTTDQLRQAVDAYVRAYEQSFMQQWGKSPFVGHLSWQDQPGPVGSEGRRPQGKERPPRLVPARPGDKQDAIDVEFVRLR